MAKWFQKFLEKLSKANSDAFQGQKLDCCDLNKQNKNQAENQDKKKKIENINKRNK